eukprot:582356-Pyramimonas_sp.AAC.1
MPSAFRLAHWEGLLHCLPDMCIKYVRVICAVHVVFHRWRLCKQPLELAACLWVIVQSRVVRDP